MQILPCTLPHGFVRRCARPNKLLSLDPPTSPLFHPTVIVAVTLLVEVEPAAPQRTNKLCSRNTQRLGNSCRTKRMRVLARFSSPSFAPFRISFCLAFTFNPVSFFCRVLSLQREHSNASQDNTGKCTLENAYLYTWRGYDNTRRCTSYLIR